MHFTAKQLKFSSYTKKEILDFSSIEIYSPYAFDTLGHPTSHGLYDEHMGPIKNDNRCKTCGLGYFECVGHFGHIDLKGVYFNPLLIDRVVCFMRNFCIFCGTRKTENEIDSPKNGTNKLTENELKLETNKNINLLKKTSCLCKKRIKRVGNRITVNGIEMTPLDVREGMRKHVDCDRWFLEVLPVVPNRFRPVNFLNGKVFEDSQNSMLCRIIKVVNTIENEVNKNKRIKNSEDNGDKIEFTIDDSETENDKNEKQKYAIYGIINNLIFAYFDNPDAALFGIKQLLERKEGLFRKHVLGKRVNFAARSVIAPDPNIETGQIGIPLVFAKKLTFPEPVTHFNYDRLRHCVINGSLWPGATFVQNNDTLISLKHIPEENRVSLANQLAIGNKVVHRHLTNNDIVLVNRQPTLHKCSFMSHEVRIIPNEKTIRMHYANCKAYNADFDGDEMNVHFAQSYLARSECLNLVSTNSNYKVETSGNPIRGLVQDYVIAAVILSRNCFITRSEFFSLIVECINTKQTIKYEDKTLRNLKYKPTILRPVKMYTGKQIITFMLLHNKYFVNTEIKSKIGNETVLFKNGVFIKGVLDKNSIGINKNCLVEYIGDTYGQEHTDIIMTLLSRLYNKVLKMKGFTLGIEELYLNENGYGKLEFEIVKAIEVTDKVIYEYIGDNKLNNGIVKKDINNEKTNSVYDGIPYYASASKLHKLDVLVRNELNKIKFNISDYHQKKNNNLALIVLSGAKGSVVNMNQMCAYLGQQELEGKRVPLTIVGRSLSGCTAESGGFIKKSFLEGIDVHSYFYHCMAGREGLIDTAVKTSRSGYLQRCLMKHLEGIIVQYNNCIGTDKRTIAFSSTAQPGEAVGINAAHSIGEPSTQMTLNTFHLAGVGSLNMTLGIPRLVEIIMMASKKIKTPYLRIPHRLNGEYNIKLTELINKIVVKEELEKGEFGYNKTITTRFYVTRQADVEKIKSIIEEVFSNMVIRKVKKIRRTVGFIKDGTDRIVVDKNEEEDKSNDEEKEIKSGRGDTSSEEEDKISGGEEDKISDEKSSNEDDYNSVEEETEDEKAKMEDSDESISNSIDSNEHDNLTYKHNSCEEGSIEKRNEIEFKMLLNDDIIFVPLIEQTVEEIVIDKLENVKSVKYVDGGTVYEGTNMDTIYSLILKGEDLSPEEVSKCYTNDLQNVRVHLGVEAARIVICKEINTVLSAYGIEVQNKHIELLSDYMAHSGCILSLSRRGNFDSDLQRMCFESCYSVLRECVENEKFDEIKNPSACQVVGKAVEVGTNSFEVEYVFE